MIEVIREFVVKEEVRGQFELVFGRGGAWSKLFAQSPGFRGATLLLDTKNPQRYLLIDLWDTEDQQEQAVAEKQSEYAELNADLDDWTVSRSELGVFRIRAEAVVRPRGSAGRRGRRSRR